MMKGLMWVILLVVIWMLNAGCTAMKGFTGCGTLLTLEAGNDIRAASYNQAAVTRSTVADRSNVDETMKGGDTVKIEAELAALVDRLTGMLGAQGSAPATASLIRISLFNRPELVGRNQLLGTRSLNSLQSDAAITMEGSDEVDGDL